MGIEEAPVEAVRESLQQVFLLHAANRDSTGPEVVEFARILSNELMRRATAQ